MEIDDSGAGAFAGAGNAAFAGGAGAGAEGGAACNNGAWTHDTTSPASTRKLTLAGS
jgi:hypothetical protein